MGLVPRKLYRFLLMFSTGFTSLCYFFFLYWLPSLSLCSVCDSISSNIDEVIFINQSANVFVFGDFNAHHKDWLTYSGGTDWPGEICYNFPISNDLTQVVNFSTRIPDCDSDCDSFYSSDTSTCSTMAFPPLETSDHVVVLVSIDFPTNSKQDDLFHRIAYDYSCADCNGLCDHLRCSIGSIFKLCCKWILWVGSSWNWCKYISFITSGQTSLISMISSCSCCCHSS